MRKTDKTILVVVCIITAYGILSELMPSKSSLDKISKSPTKEIQKTKIVVPQQSTPPITTTQSSTDISIRTKEKEILDRFFSKYKTSEQTKVREGSLQKTKNQIIEGENGAIYFYGKNKRETAQTSQRLKVYKHPHLDTSSSITYNLPMEY